MPITADSANRTAYKEHNLCIRKTSQHWPNRDNSPPMPTTPSRLEKVSHHPTLQAHRPYPLPPSRCGELAVASVHQRRLACKVARKFSPTPAVNFHPHMSFLPATLRAPILPIAVDNTSGTLFYTHSQERRALAASTRAHPRRYQHFYGR